MAFTGLTQAGAVSLEICLRACVFIICKQLNMLLRSWQPSGCRDLHSSSCPRVIVDKFNARFKMANF